MVTRLDSLERNMLSVDEILRTRCVVTMLPGLR